jgi:hypothetical protein
MIARTIQLINHRVLARLVAASLAVAANPAVAQTGQTCSAVQQQMEQLKLEFRRSFMERPLSTGCTVLLGDTAISILMEDSGSRLPPELRIMGGAICVGYCALNEKAECGPAAITIIDLAARYSMLKATQQRECLR